jgi:hypothetical protein
MANKKTVVQMYEEILAIEGLTTEQKAFLEKRIELTKKKNAKPTGGELTPKQREKMATELAVENAIVEVMNPKVRYTPTDLVKVLNREDITSTQKLTPRLTSMVETGRLIKTTDKGRNYYSLPSVAEVGTEGEGE